MTKVKQKPKQKSISNSKSISLTRVAPQISAASALTTAGSVLVVFSSQKGKDKSPVLLSAAVETEVQLSIESEVLTGKFLETLSYREKNAGACRHLVVVGLGPEDQLDHERLRQAGAAAYDAAKALAAGKRTKATAEGMVLDFDYLMESTHGRSYLAALVEGIALASYSFDELKSRKEEPSSEAKGSSKLPCTICARAFGDSELKSVAGNALAVANWVNFARRLGDMPGNLMTPTALANEASKAAKSVGLRCTVWDKNRIKKERMGGLLGVAQGSSQDPRFIIMEHRGGKASDRPVVLVGKGLTFDSGGISIKPSASMEEMKYDMCGGAAIIGAMLAIAQLKLKVNVIGLVASTENMPGPSATKPGDIHIARNGKSFEVNNTDAEGRLILADALSYASELKPKAIFDAATLTGAIVVALGNTHTGMFTRSKEVTEKIKAAAEKSGELIWPMPLIDQHLKDMKGTYADLSNISSFKGAGSATAAAFLEQFVGEGIPWAHFDIAGTAWAVGSRLNYCPRKGASGVMVRTFVELVQEL